MLGCESMTLQPQHAVFQGGAAFRRRVARALVLVVAAALITWVALVATAVVPNGGTVELPAFVGPLQRAVAPATSTPAPNEAAGASSEPIAATPTAAPRPAIVIPPLPFFPTPTPAPTATAAPTATPNPGQGGGPPPGRTPERTPRTSPPGRSP
jgi:hypothetical protein